MELFSALLALKQQNTALHDYILSSKKWVIPKRAYSVTTLNDAIKSVVDTFKIDANQLHLPKPRSPILITTFKVQLNDIPMYPKVKEKKSNQTPSVIDDSPLVIDDSPLVIDDSPKAKSASKDSSNEDFINIMKTLVQECAANNTKLQTFYKHEHECMLFLAKVNLYSKSKAHWDKVLVEFKKLFEIDIVHTESVPEDVMQSYSDTINAELAKKIDYIDDKIKRYFVVHDQFAYLLSAFRRNMKFKVEHKKWANMISNLFTKITKLGMKTKTDVTTKRTVKTNIKKTKKKYKSH
jgi:hypothetical protein